MPNFASAVAVKTVIREVASNGYEDEDDAWPHKNIAEANVLDRSLQSVWDSCQIEANQTVNRQDDDDDKPRNPKKSTKKKESKSKVQGECIISPTEGAKKKKASPEANARLDKPNTSPSLGKSRRLPAKEVFSGPPNEPLEGGWPPGWIKKVVERQTGASAGGTDRYWYSPQTNKKFRSMAEIKRFMAHLKAYGGDEDAAWIRFKAK